MKPEEFSELRSALRVIRQYAGQPEVAEKLPGMLAVAEVLAEQVEQELGARPAGRYKPGGVILPGGGLVGGTPPASAPVQITVHEPARRGSAEYEKRLREAKRKRGIGT